jgi:hypothetical protein
MHETNDNLTALQRLLDASYARAGEHLRMIWGEDSRLDARQLRDELVGVQVLDLATVTPRGEPRVAPVDGFSSAATSGSDRPTTRCGFATSAPTRR